MTTDVDTKVQLQVQKKIRRVEDDLVNWIQDALDKTNYGKSGRDKLEESQFRNLIRVSDTTESPEVIKNFLRYQVGREAKWGRGEGSLAERIIRDIDGNIKKVAEAIAKEADSKDSKSIWIELIRRYLGYGARYLKYLNDGQK